MAKKNKILFILRAPLGFRGTSGTFLLINALRENYDVQVISPYIRNVAKDIVHEGNIKNTIVRHEDSDSVIAVDNIIKKFQPNLIYMVNSPFFLRYIYVFKGLYPKIKWILDVRTPLLAKNKEYKKIRKSMFFAQFYVDKIISLNHKSVKTWIPYLFRSTSIYPLSLDMSKFDLSLTRTSKQEDQIKFVFIGTLHKLRRIDKLIEIFASSVNKINKKMIFDIYGSGQAIEELSDLVIKLNMQDHIHIKGILKQEKLFKLLPVYDVGIAYVPFDIYEDSPSLKSIEYAGAGLHIIASNTNAHVKYHKEGLQMSFFDNTSNSFIEAINYFIKSNDKEIVVQNNLKVVRKHHYSNIKDDFFIPYIKDLIN